MLREFSQRTRARALERLDAGPAFDMLIIGGGITGVGAAREAAIRGYHVALVEKGDFASGTSSKSTKLVHGGLRYLEQFEFSLVFEALQERRTLLAQAPHLVWPQPIVYPIYRGEKNGFYKLTAGMWAYDMLALFRNVRRHRMLRGARGVQEEVPGLNSRELEGAAYFFDARTNDSRLTLVNAQQAHDAGATLLTRARVVGFTRSEGGDLSGVRIRDSLGGQEHTVRARILVNCTGPWTDHVIQLADPSQPARMAPSKGVHLVFSSERLPLPDGEALYVTAPRDSRPVFIIPWENVTIIGTTDTFYGGDPDNIPVTADDVEYLLEVANFAFPDAGLSVEDVRSSWAGLRPLIKDPGAVNESSTSREHDIWEAPSGMVNIAGGKLTTYRVMAQEVIDAAAEKLERRHAVPARRAAPTERLPLPGAEFPLPEENPTALEDDIWRHLVRSYGVYAQDLAREVEEQPSARERIVSGLPYIRAELDHALTYEMCLTAEDFLARRTWLIYEAPYRGEEVLDKVVAWMGERLGWDEARRKHEVSQYRQHLALLAGWSLPHDGADVLPETGNGEGGSGRISEAVPRPTEGGGH